MTGGAGTGAGGGIRATLRVCFVGGYISYRALFNWIHPALYIPTMLLGPVFQILFFVYLGRFVQLRDDAFFVVGNAVQIAAMAGVYAGVMAIANERQFQTLSALLASPANRPALFIGRALPVIANGMLVSAWGFGVSALLLHFRPPAASLAPLALVVLVCVVSCTAWGLALGSLGMRFRDVFLIANIAYYLMWIFCGVNLPESALPTAMVWIGRLLPMTHGIQAARAVAGGGSLADAATPLAVELGIGLAYVGLALVLFRLFELEGKRRATLEQA